MLAEDVSERKRSEELLHESEERQTFLLKLSDVLRYLVEPDMITAAATPLLGEDLGTSRASYVHWPAGEGYGEVAQD